VTLSAFDAERRLLLHCARSATAVIAQQQTRRTPLLLSIDGTDRQSDGRTPDRYTYPAPHTTQAVSVTHTVAS